MKREKYPFIRLYGLPKFLSSDMQASVFTDLFAQIVSRFNHNHSETGCCYDDSARVAAISAVDKGIRVARQFLGSLLTCRNTLVPISVLPPEILARVFHFLVVEDPPFTGRQNLGWIRVTHVCQQWRKVALDDSSLWAKIFSIPKNTKWISETLARARNVPLDVAFHAVTKSSREALLMITPHISNTRQLRFHSMSTRNFERVPGIYSCEAPALEHFELKVDDYSLESPNIFRHLRLRRNILFKGHSPRLRTFSISQVVIPWSIVPRGQLTALKIAGPYEGAELYGDLNGLIDLLVNCPSLEILALELCLPSQLTAFSPGQTIHLPHLSRLCLCGSTLRIMNMLNMLKLPSSTTLDLECISGNTDNDSEGLLLPVISAQFPSVEFKSLAITMRGVMTSSLNITASTFPSALGNPQSQSFEGDKVGNPELVLSFESLSIGYSTDLLKQACKLLPISNLEFISISATNIIDINWVELFSCCTNVTTMQAIGRGTSGLVRALAVPTVTNAGPSKDGRKQEEDNRSTVIQPACTVARAHATIFPKMKILGLTELNFYDGSHTSDILFNVFKSGLQQRMAASGAPLTLRISNCEISAGHTNDLRKLARDFHWNKGEGSIGGFEY